jgi:hypothetical protein
MREVEAGGRPSDLYGARPVFRGVLGRNEGGVCVRPMWSGSRLLSSKETNMRILARFPRSGVVSVNRRDTRELSPGRNLNIPS